MCIEKNHLNILIAARWVKAPSIDPLSERQIQSCAEERCNEKKNGDQLYSVNQVVNAVGINMSPEDAGHRAWFFKNKYINNLRAAGYANSNGKKPHIAINKVLSNLKPVQLC